MKKKKILLQNKLNHYQFGFNKGLFAAEKLTARLISVFSG